MSYAYTIHSGHACTKPNGHAHIADVRADERTHHRMVAEQETLPGGGVALQHHGHLQHVHAHMVLRAIQSCGLVIVSLMSPTAS